MRNIAPAKVQYAYRAVFVLFIVWGSIRTLMEALTATGAADSHHHLVIWLAPLEIIGAVAFLAPPIELLAGALLWIVFAIATLHELSVGGVPVRFLFYACTVAVIVYAHRSQPIACPRGPSDVRPEVRSA